MEFKQPYSENIAALIEHSHAMLKHAEAGEWETVAEDEAIRRALIDAYFSKPSNLASEPDISGAIRELLQINDRLEQLTLDAREAVGAEAHTISTGRKAVSAYADNAR